MSLSIHSAGTRKLSECNPPALHHGLLAGGMPTPAPEAAAAALGRSHSWPFPSLTPLTPPSLGEPKLHVAPSVAPRPCTAALLRYTQALSISGLQ